MARTCATIVNSNGFRTGAPAREAEFFPDFDRNAETPGQSVEEMKAVGRRMAMMGDMGD